MATGPDPDLLVKIGAFTNSNYRNVYPAIDPTRPELSQEGKVVVITGASRGLGRTAFAASFAHAKASVIVLLARSVDGLSETEKLVKAISPETVVACMQVDVLDEVGVNQAFEQIVAKFGVPHVLINNAGLFVALEKIKDSALDWWWNTQEVNIKGTFITTKAFLKAADSDPTIPKTIINLASGAAVNVPPGMSTYSMSKLGIIKFTEFLKVEHPTITSVSLDPGCVHTDMGDAVGFLQPFMHDTPGLCGGFAVWLSSGDKSFLSGRYVLANWDVDELEKRKEEIVDGGLLATCLKGKFGGDDIVVHSYSK